MQQSRISEGHPFPLGATWDGSGVNFALFSAHATRVELCLFDADGREQIDRIDMPEFTDEIWHVRIEGLAPGTVYGYRVHGPYAPEEGHRFNPNKLLLDPYAKAYVGDLKWDHAVFGYTIGAPEEDLSFDTRDSAAFMPKCVVVDQAFSWEHPLASRVPWDQSVVYEAHVRGYTKRHPLVPKPLQGTFAGLGQQPVTDYLKSLGVTTVELLPVHAFVNDSHLLDKGLTNYWGYNTIGFFAPDQRFLSGKAGNVQEIKQTIDRFHQAGLEVIMDVVYNHTAEGSERGPTLSFRGIDNASYYRLLPDQKRYYINDTGTGNTVNLSHPRVLQMVTDSLRYWVTEMQIDGFRFDLATILAREPQGFDYESGFLKACRQDPILSSVKLIAEPWDCGPGGYQVGNFPPGWGEWNDKFRDTARRFWKGDEGMAPELARRLTASADLFDHRGRRPWASVNFVTAHDGFTLHDLVSYNDKHNDANGEENRDGSSDNNAWNCGAEGPTDNPDIIALRERQKRNLLATLLLSQGTPMLCAGDEFGRTQQGNNNAYCQDNEISWVDWDRTEDGQALTAFVQNLITLRRKLPVLRRSRFLSGDLDEATQVADVRWLSPTGDDLTPEQWGDGNMRCFGLVLDGRARTSGIRKPASDATVLLVVNAHHEPVNFALPDIPGEDEWTCLIDTNMAVRDELPVFQSGDVYQVTAHSLLLFSLAAKGATARVFDELEKALTTSES
ncbi:glycogen debranching protein GlgX [Cupriavidus sp. SZY C1]|uniref:glycogen debranching protein GlgX n=1 Tax=Cupriavidus sp. SZY C1 TaxID=3055037 RepID=UPI0028B9D3D3|nr:glycogen debranching protein GlgX [Cupriavidus sp. SZY C1]MDT6962062.1 glycogen debranching protein GlgX [Cupriavidus sp. SZY C1]